MTFREDVENTQLNASILVEVLRLFVTISFTLRKINVDNFLLYLFVQIQISSPPPPICLRF